MRLAAFVIGAFLLLTTGAVVEARALTDAVDVMVLVDRTVADYGESVNVTTYIFDRGVPTDPSTVAAFVDRLPGLSSLNITRQSVGVFPGVFTFQSHPTEVIVNATVDGTQESGHAFVFHKFLPGVRIVPSPGVAHPGESVSIEVDVVGSNGPQDATFVNLTAEVLSAPDFLRVALPTSLSATRVAIGTYLASYAVPASIDHDSVVSLFADVSMGAYGFGLGASIYVPVPNALLVWYRTVASDPSNQTLFVYVASSAGVPLANASVSIHTFSIPFTIQRLNGTTDSSGLARFDLPINETVSEFLGNASYGALSESFGGFLLTPDFPVVQVWSVVWLNPAEVFAPGESANLRFRLEQNGSGVPHQDLFVYGHTDSKFVLAEALSTNATGEFAVGFIAPTDTVWLDIRGFIGGSWQFFGEGFLARNHLIARITSMDGRHLSIVGNFPSLAGPWTGYLDLRGLPEPKASAESVEPAGNFFVAALVAGSAGETFTFDVELPLFLPAGLPVVVSIEAVSLRYETGRNGLYLFSQTVIVGTPIPGPTNLGLWILVSGLAFLVAVLVVVRHRRRPPSADDPTSNEEVAPESGKLGADTSRPRE